MSHDREQFAQVVSGPGPDQRISSIYRRQFWQRSKENPRAAADLLLNFQKEHPREFWFADWVEEAVGYIAMGAGVFSQPIAQSWFRGYWSEVAGKKAQRNSRLFHALQQFDNHHHRKHCLQAIKLIKNLLKAGPLSPRATWATFYEATPCDECLPQDYPTQEFFLLLQGTIESDPSMAPTDALKAALARRWGISVRSFEGYRARFYRTNASSNRR
jgi:hypothetical protein